MNDSKLEQTTIWIKLTEISAGNKSLSESMARIDGKIDERNRIMVENMKEMKREFKAEFKEVSQRVEELEKFRNNAKAIYWFLGILAICIGWLAGLGKDIVEIVKGIGA